MDESLSLRDKKLKGEQVLMYSVLRQAVDDYNQLRSKGQEKFIDKYKGGGYSLEDTETFFNSPWCDKILENLGIINMNGRDILHKLKEQYS